MTRSELKQLIRETIEELTSATLRSAGAASSDRNRAIRFYTAAAERDAAAVKRVFSKDTTLRIKPHSAKNPVQKFIIIGFDKYENKPAIRILSDKDEIMMITDDPDDSEVSLIDYYGKKVSAKFDLASKKKIIMGFHNMDYNVDPNRIQLFDKDKNLSQLELPLSELQLRKRQ